MAFIKGSLGQTTQMWLGVSEHSWYLPGLSPAPHLALARSFSLRAACQHGNWETPTTYYLKLIFYPCPLPPSPCHRLEMRGSPFLSPAAPRAPDPARSCSSALAMSYWDRWRFPESFSKNPLLKNPRSDRRSCLDTTCQNSTLHTVLTHFATDPQTPGCVKYLLFI